MCIDFKREHRVWVASTAYIHEPPLHRTFLEAECIDMR